MCPPRDSKPRGFPVRSSRSAAESAGPAFTPLGAASGSSRRPVSRRGGGEAPPAGGAGRRRAARCHMCRGEGGACAPAGLRDELTPRLAVECGDRACGPPTFPDRL